ncbi:MAG: hypothetical protein PCFJNLEI_02531 [Verrucomicrobiae bacterium]|nr:hypothetical protein [Verrucomicrobiae bacterium]
MTGFSATHVPTHPTTINHPPVRQPNHASPPNATNPITGPTHNRVTRNALSRGHPLTASTNRTPATLTIVIGEVHSFGRP